MTSKRIKRPYAKYFLFFILLWFVYNAISIRFYSKEFYESESDIAIVLGAGTANGNLSNVYLERVSHAIHLLEEGKVKKILFTGGYGEGQAISDSKCAEIYALQQGIPKSKILIEEKSTYTFENLIESKKLMLAHGFSSALLVSDPYHMKRSMEMCKKIGVNALPSPTPTTMYRSRKTKFSFLMKEVINYCFYQIYGRYRDVSIPQESLALNLL